MKPAVKKLLMAAVLLLLAALCLLFLFGSTDDMVTVTYEMDSDQIASPICLALVTDLHSCDYGEGQGDLMAALQQADPDAVLLGGDIIDDDLPRDKAEEFVTQAAKIWPTFYVSGNHEYRREDMDDIKAFLRASGAVVLEGHCQTLTVNGQTIQLCGVDDPAGIGDPAFDRQLFQACQETDPTLFTVLLSHRPERIDQYRAYGFDLVLSGHAHGGQWRIPGLLNGLLAPNQGLFPDYAGGRYDFPDYTFLVSRGLARETTFVPRLFNPPELVIVHLT